MNEPTDVDLFDSLMGKYIAANAELQRLRELKLYVWEEGILTDYTDGMLCVLATSLEHAREVAAKVLARDAYNDSTSLTVMQTTGPRIHEIGDGCVSWGGG